MTNKRNDIFSQGADPSSVLEKMEKKFSMSQAEFLEKEFGFKVKVFEAILPSKGLLYAEDHPLHGKESVEFLPMSVREEDIIRNRKLIENKTMGMELLRSCLVDKKIDPKTLFPGDALAILYSVRGASYGTNFHTSMNCPKCGTNQKVSIDLAEIEEKEIAEDITPGSNVFSTVLPSTGVKAEYKILTEQEELDLSNEQEAREKKGVAPTDSTNFVMNVLISVNGITDRTKVNMFAQRMPALDALHLRKEVLKHQPGLKSEFFFSCSNSMCRHEATLPIPLSLEFWLPEVDR